MACRKQRKAPICQEPSKLYDACCSVDAPARGVHPASSLYQGNPVAAYQPEMRSQSDIRDTGSADLYLSVQYITKHVSQRTVVQPGSMLTDVTVTRALLMILSVLSTSFVVLAALFVLQWKRRAKSSKAVGRKLPFTGL
jgi:hypothetical protein